MTPTSFWFRGTSMSLAVADDCSTMWSHKFVLDLKPQVMKFTGTGVAFATILQALVNAPSAYAKLRNSRPRAETRHHKPVPRPLPKALEGKLGNTPQGKPETKIVGGEEVSGPDVYPFFVSWDGECGGSLIHPDIVLSAAHCNEIESTTLTIDAFKLNDSSTAGAVSRTIVDRSVHPQYNADTVANDFVLLKLSGPVTTVTPIDINTLTSAPQVGEELTVIGLGNTSDGGSQATTLMQVKVNAVSDEACNTAYGGGIEGDVMLCAGVDGGGKDSCQGDSGGPIFTMKNGKADKQVGVVSWGWECASPEYPGVYAEVSSANDWINSEICRLSTVKPSSCSGGDPPPPPPPGNNSPPPTPSPTPGDNGGDTPAPSPFTDDGYSYGDCEDTDGLVFVDNAVGDRSCSWLNDNFAWYGYLCEFIDVIEVCPSTCDWCELFVY